MHLSAFKSFQMIIVIDVLFLLTVVRCVVTEEYVWLTMAMYVNGDGVCVNVDDVCC